MPPSVPVYDSPLVEPRAYPSPRASGRGSLWGSVGSDLSGVAEDMRRYYEKEVAEENQFRVEAQINKLQDAKNDLLYGQSGATKVLGENVFKRDVPFTQDYQQQLDEKIKEIGGDLSNEDQRRKFGVYAGRLRSQMTAELQRHEAQQGAAFRESTFKGIVANETENIARAVQQNLVPPTAPSFQPPGTLDTTTAPGMVEPGNISNLYNRPVLKNPDGSVSTTLSMSFNDGGKEVLIPTVVDGKKLTTEEAIAHYRDTGEHLGKFDTPAAADAYANALHTEQEKYQNARSAPPADPIQYSIDRVKNNARLYLSRELGMSKEQVDSQVLGLESAMHKVVIDRYLEAHNPAAAKAYYDANRDRINNTDGAQVRVQIEKDSRDTLVVGAADNIWNRFGPKGDTDAVNLDVMEREANKTFPNDGDARKLLISELRSRQAAFDYSAKQRRDNVEGGIWKRVLNNDSLASIRQSPEFRLLDGKSQASMVTTIEAFQKRNENDPDVQLRKFATYWSLASDPKRLSQMSDAEIFAKSKDMGVELTKALLKGKQELVNNADKALEASIDQDSFNYFVREAGMNAAPTGENDKKTLGELKYRIESIIDAEQRKKVPQRQLTRQEKDDLLKKLLTEVPVTVKGRLWGTTTESRKLYEVQYPENIVIPPADRAAIVGALQKAGIANPTDAQIREGFIRLRMK